MNLSKQGKTYRILFLFLAVALGGTRPALALSDQTIKTKEKEAKKACLSAGQYEQGIDILAELYAETNNPTYIYNQGRCYQQSGKHEKALDRFQEYQRKNPKMSAQDASDLEQRISECEAKIASLSPGSNASVAGTGEKKSPESNPILIPEVMASDAPPPATELAKSGRGLRVAGGILSGVGLIGIGSGVTLNYLYSKKTNTSQGTYASSIDKSADNYRVFAWVGYGVGAAALVTGITLYVLGARSEDGKSGEESQVAIVPSYANGTATVVVRGSFR